MGILESKATKSEEAWVTLALTLVVRFKRLLSVWFSKRHNHNLTNRFYSLVLQLYAATMEIQTMMWTTYLMNNTPTPMLIRID